MEEEYHHGEEFLKLLFKGLIPIIFFIGGVVILISRISGWSLILGLPVTIIGIAILINVFDEITSSIILPRSHITACMVCKKPTLVIPGIAEDQMICAKCRQNLVRSAKS